LRSPDARAVLLDLRRLAFIGVAELLRCTQDVAARHLHFLAALVKECELRVAPEGIADRAAPAAALREPQIPLPIDGRVMQPENRILRGGWHAAHVAADSAMNGAVRTVDGRLRVVEIEQRIGVGYRGPEACRDRSGTVIQRSVATRIVQRAAHD